MRNGFSEVTWRLVCFLLLAAEKLRCAQGELPLSMWSLQHPWVPVNYIEKGLGEAGGAAHHDSLMSALPWPCAGNRHPEQNLELLPQKSMWWGQSCLSAPHLHVFPPKTSAPVLAYLIRQQ